MIIDHRVFYPIACLALLIALLPAPCDAQPGTKKFSQLTTSDGLSQSTVNCILKDQYGFMWFGTRDGLNKYDGTTFTVYRNNPSNPHSIPDNQIKCLEEDSQGSLWIGTLGGGFCYYDRNRDAFFRPADLGLQSDSPLNPAILSMMEDKKGRLWIGSYPGPLAGRPEK